MSPRQATRLTAPIKDNCLVFNPDGVKHTVIGYECDIDTGNARPISCGNVNYGPIEYKVTEKHISVLVHMKHSYHISHSWWMSKGLLAPKPHQENVYDIVDFKWRFYVNYIKLNQVKLVMIFLIPCCDIASMYEFGDGRFYWFLGFPMEYHQVEVNARSRERLAFAGPNASMYTYRLMNFGPVNGPSIYIGMMFDMNFWWQTLAKSCGVEINEDANTKIIVDDFLNHAITEDVAFENILCQFKVDALRRFSFSLPKSSLFPKRVELVGIDIGINNNIPDKSKHELLRTCPKLRDIRAVAAFIAFGMFYQNGFRIIKSNSRL